MIPSFKCSKTFPHSETRPERLHIKQWSMCLGSQSCLCYSGFSKFPTMTRSLIYSFINYSLSAFYATITRLAIGHMLGAMGRGEKYPDPGHASVKVSHVTAEKNDHTYIEASYLSDGKINKIPINKWEILCIYRKYNERKRKTRCHQFS